MNQLLADLRLALDAFSLAAAAGLPAESGDPAAVLAAIDLRAGLALMRAGLLQAESAAAQHPAP